ncbi:uncharacterized protein [Diabrotica undecimpunctata]|uniref:uncharacterized protein n=1 Tax=Diabrotica undecimpunctata TaxID=50387 RepID=UPI003B634BCB
MLFNVVVYATNLTFGMGFYEDIRLQYGPLLVSYLKEWANVNTKLAALRNRKTFLIKCRNADCFPNHITNSLTNVNNLLHHRRGEIDFRAQGLSKRFGKNILNLEIKITFADINHLENKLKDLQAKSKSILNYYTYVEFKRRQQVIYNNLFHKIKRTNINKFNKFRLDSFDSIDFRESWFKNLTDLEFPVEVKKLLALGPKFALLPNKKDFKVSSLLADIENILRPIENVDKDILRSKCTNIITNFLNKDEKDHFLNKYYIKCKTFLKHHPEIKIVQSDKGNVTVAMYTRDYIQKCEDLLTDTKYYKKLNNNPVCTLQQKANKLVSDLVKENQIDQSVGKSLKIYNAIAPRFYALPKIHKPTLSMRPIVSSIGTPNGPIASFLTNILTETYSNNSEFCIQDSFSFSSFINNFKLPTNYKLVSFDVVSLFTNLPLHTILVSVEKHWDDISIHTTLNLANIKKLISFVFDSNVFIFNDCYYKQVFGTPMGSSISPILCNYVLDDLIEDSLQQINFEIPFIKRYVDDLILALPADSIHSTLNVFNQQNPHLQFTCEEEREGSLPFLDMSLHRCEDNVVKTQWYRKPICSNRFISYHSYHPPRMKTNLVLAMKERVKRLSHPDYLQHDLNLLRNIFVENSYPLRLINKLIFNVPFVNRNNILTMSQSVPSAQNISAPTSVYFYALPYIPKLTEKRIQC